MLSCLYPPGSLRKGLLLTEYCDSSSAGCNRAAGLETDHCILEGAEGPNTRLAGYRSRVPDLISNGRGAGNYCIGVGVTLFDTVGQDAVDVARLVKGW